MNASSLLLPKKKIESKQSELWVDLWQSLGGSKNWCAAGGEIQKKGITPGLHGGFLAERGEINNGRETVEDQKRGASFHRSNFWRATSRGDRTRGRLDEGFHGPPNQTHPSSYFHCFGSLWWALCFVGFQPPLSRVYNRIVPNLKKKSSAAGNILRDITFLVEKNMK